MSALDAIWVPLATIMVAFVGALGTWLATKRKAAGTIKTSEAAEIWKANSDFRSMLIQEAQNRTAENAALRASEAECRKIQLELERRVLELERQVGSGSTPR